MRPSNARDAIAIPVLSRSSDLSAESVGRAGRDKKSSTGRVQVRNTKNPAGRKLPTASADWIRAKLRVPRRHLPSNEGGKAEANSTRAFQ